VKHRRRLEPPPPGSCWRFAHVVILAKTLPRRAPFGGPPIQRNRSIFCAEITRQPVFRSRPGPA
jgi:hypothetical protein